MVTCQKLGVGCVSQSHAEVSVSLMHVFTLVMSKLIIIEADIEFKPTRANLEVALKVAD